MADTAHIGRISEQGFKACLGLFLSLSILAVTARTVIRIRTRHKLYADDGFLFLGLTCMAIATGLAYPIVSITYLQEAINFEPGWYTLPLNDLPKILQDFEISDAFVVFAWTAEFSVKISLLLFFRLLVKRLPALTLYVKFAIGICTLVWAVLVCEPFMTCPHSGLSVLTQCTPPNIPLTVGLTVLITLLDILTDLMIASIPLIILWKASMGIHQKVGIGAFLTVNIWLIVLALVRITSFKRGSTFDLTWILFFQFFEPNVAILAACFSAFRSLFVTNGHGRRVQQDRPWYSYRKRLFRKGMGDELPLHDLPSIPGPTLSGMRTMIWQDDRSKAVDYAFNHSFSKPAVEEHVGDATSTEGISDQRNQIVVSHDWSLESTRVTSSHDGFSDRQFV